MANEKTTNSALASLQFEMSAADCFGFLIDDGFKVLSTSPELVTFGRDKVEVSIYHDEVSGEVDLDVGVGATRYSMGELIRILNPERAEEYKAWASTTAIGVRAGLTRLAALLVEFGGGAMSGDRFTLKRLRDQRLDWLRRYESEVSIARSRTLADAAYREGRFLDAVKFLRSLGSQATEVERRKLKIALRETGCTAPDPDPPNPGGRSEGT